MLLLLVEIFCIGFEAESAAVADCGRRAVDVAAFAAVGTDYWGRRICDGFAAVGAAVLCVGGGHCCCCCCFWGFRY